MGKEPQSLALRIRGLLDRLVACRQLSTDEQEIVGDEVAAEARILPREGILEAIDTAIGSSEMRGPTFSEPGQSLRAAQALCDIYEWPFEWNKSYVAKTVARVRGELK